MTPAIARVRAILGLVFALLGAIIATQILLRNGPFNQKLLGLAFAGVLIALGIVRVRGYYLATRRPSK